MKNVIKVQLYNSVTQDNTVHKKVYNNYATSNTSSVVHTPQYSTVLRDGMESTAMY